MYQKLYFYLGLMLFNVANTLRFTLPSAIYRPERNYQVCIHTIGRGARLHFVFPTHTNLYPMRGNIYQNTSYSSGLHRNSTSCPTSENVLHLHCYNVNCAIHLTPSQSRNQFLAQALNNHLLVHGNPCHPLIPSPPQSARSSENTTS